MKSIKKKLSIIALAASILGCKSAMAMSTVVSPLISAGQKYFYGKNKSGRNGSKEKSKQRDKVDISLPIPTLGDLMSLYLVANEVAGDSGLSNREFFGKHTVAKFAKQGIQYGSEKCSEFVDYLENKRKAADCIESQKLFDKTNNIQREEYFYQNLEKVYLHFGVGLGTNHEISSKLADIIRLERQSNGDFSYNFLSDFKKNGKSVFGDDIAVKINFSGFRSFVNYLRGERKLDIDKNGNFIFGDAKYYVEYSYFYKVDKFYDRLKVTNLNSKSFDVDSFYVNDYAEFFWKI